MSDLRIVADRLRRVFPGGAGVHDLSLDVAAGEVHAIVGLNGAGKTTLMRLLLGMLRPDAGSVLLDGRDLRHADATTWRRVGHVVDHPLVYPELDTRTNLGTAARLHGVPAASIPEVVERALHEHGIERYATVRAGVLSAGNRQRLGVAAALAHPVAGHAPLSRSGYHGGRECPGRRLRAWPSSGGGAGVPGRLCPVLGTTVAAKAQVGGCARGPVRVAAGCDQGAGQWVWPAAQR